ncbi:putative mfs multidrug [Diplodia seriata]|uniref:Putative mfs multidrug n=1 Tax=Diplodia seriata TaxID=420778 RepID=A0A0G2EVQ3_9PEZI|nr:putative mfs multidrug [Diplodia seriata]
MFGFHRRTRSLIPVKDLAKYEKVAGTEEQEFLTEEEEYDSEMTEPTGTNHTQLTWIYVVFLAEAIMASSLQPQLKMLVSSNEQYCSTLSGSYLRSILDCAYAFGAAAGILWGYLADRVGRRTVALAGLYGMSACCLSMGFATDLIACTILRFVAGLVSSAIVVSTLAMLGDTLPQTSNSADESDMDCEKAAFLGQTLSDDSDVPSIRIVDFTRPEPISIGQFLQAPSLIVLMCSFCLLSLHASSFDVVLPHLGHSSSMHGGMGIPCDWLGLILLAVRAIAGAIILHAVPKIIERFGLLRPFRSCALFFPALYIITPLLAFLTMCSTPVTAIISSAAIMIKHLLAGGAQVLVILLMLNVAPDAFSAGTVIGLMQAASLFKALAVAVSGASFYLSTDYSVAATNYALWTSLAVFGAAGAGLAWFVRERPSVERDFPADVLCWETCFDAEGEQQV